MSFYDTIGVRPFINATGNRFTRFGGSIMPQPVLDAMADAARQYVNLFDLQDRTGEAIAKLTHNQAALVSAGAASGITLAIAAAIAGTHPALADRLPDTAGLPHQVLMRASDRGTEADPAIRNAGGKIIHIPGLASPADFAAAITEHTAAILLLAPDDPTSLIPLIETAHARNIPVLIDGATALPPKENLWRFTRDAGADAFVTSGGKALCGPQSTGLVLGTRDFIHRCKFHASPHLRLGRTMKVPKEEFAGIYTALSLFLTTDPSADLARQAADLDLIFSHLTDIPTILPGRVHDSLHIHLPCPAEPIAQRLLQGTPSILVIHRDNRLSLRTALLQPGEGPLLAHALATTLRTLPPTF